MTFADYVMYARSGFRPEGCYTESSNTIRERSACVFYFVECHRYITEAKVIRFVNWDASCFVRFFFSLGTIRIDVLSKHPFTHANLILIIWEKGYNLRRVKLVWHAIGNGCLDL